MMAIGARMARGWTKVGTRFMPFADAASDVLPLGKLLRLSLFQFSVGITITLLIGTLNRVMIVELSVPAWLVSLMLSVPLVVAPFRALIGFKSDTHKSVLGWKRVPYLWIGSLLQFGGLAIMPFALIDLSGDMNGPLWIGKAGAALAFLMVGAGMHTVQTSGLALAVDLAPAKSLPKVVALLCVMMLLGVVTSALSFGLLLRHFSEIHLIQVIQGAALTTMVLNIIALWKQEPRDRTNAARRGDVPDFATAWRSLASGHQAIRRLVAIGLGTVGFCMQDILLEPYGGQVLGLSVGATTSLTALLGVGGICGFVLSARHLGKDADPYRLAAFGCLAGLMAFTAVIFSAPLHMPAMFACGVLLIGFGGGLFAAGTLTAIMSMAGRNNSGLLLGAWGAVQASAAGAAIATGGFIRDAGTTWSASGHFGAAAADPAWGYDLVYHLEILLLFVTLIALGPLVRSARGVTQPITGLGIAEPTH
jgi:BCD family chlorophyll transporter-like MFS transporter